MLVLELVGQAVRVVATSILLLLLEVLLLLELLILLCLRLIGKSLRRELLLLLGISLLLRWLLPVELLIHGARGRGEVGIASSVRVHDAGTCWTSDIGLQCKNKRWLFKKSFVNHSQRLSTACVPSSAANWLSPLCGEELLET